MYGVSMKKSNYLKPPDAADQIRILPGFLLTFGRTQPRRLRSLNGEPLGGVCFRGSGWKVHFHRSYLVVSFFRNLKNQRTETNRLDCNSYCFFIMWSDPPRGSQLPSPSYINRLPVCLSICLWISLIWFERCPFPFRLEGILWLQHHPRSLT